MKRMLQRRMTGEEMEREMVTIMYEPSEKQDYIEVEAAPKDISIDIDGPRIKIDYVDRDVTGVLSNIVALFTRDFGKSIEIPKFNVAVQVDANNQVLQVINPSINGQPPAWTGPTLLEIPEEGYVLMAQDDSYAGNYIKRFLAENFKGGDIIKLRKNGEVVSVRDLMSGNGPIARIKVDNQRMYTVTDNHTKLSGKIENIDDPAAIQLLVNGTAVLLRRMDLLAIPTRYRKAPTTLKSRYSKTRSSRITGIWQCLPGTIYQPIKK